MRQKKEIDPSAIRALAIDLDGTTLLPGGGLGGRTVRCLGRLMARGIHLIVCTGRAMESSRRYCDEIGAKGPMVFFNGAIIADLPGAGLVRHSMMPLDVVDYGIDIARGMGVHYQAFFPHPGDSLNGGAWRETLVIEKQSPEAEFYQRHTGMTPIVADLKKTIAQPGLRGCVKAMFITADPIVQAEIREKMAGRFGDRVYLARTHPSFLELMNAGVSKGRGLKTAMELRGLDPRNAMAFGDEENDLPMFAAAGFSAAPFNAGENVRKAADFVFGSNADEGLAAFLEGLFEPPEKIVNVLL
ncbi:MAG: HAD hydrolase family protein [Treponema sp.]|nr:HAD hydrolase family protein [Treponema sp.]